MKNRNRFNEYYDEDEEEYDDEEYYRPSIFSQFLKGIRIFFYVLIAVALISIISNNDFDSNSSNVDRPAGPDKTEITQPTNDSDNIETKSKETKPKETESPIAITFDLIAGEQGTYGKILTYNEGTEFEERLYAYYVPSGTYRVTNVGKYMTQINVYSNEVQITDGWEEPADAMVKLIDVGETVTVVIEENYHIEIHEPTKLRLTKTE